MYIILSDRVDFFLLNGRVLMKHKKWLARTCTDRRCDYSFTCRHPHRPPVSQCAWARVFTHGGDRQVVSSAKILTLPRYTSYVGIFPGKHSCEFITVPHTRQCEAARTTSSILRTHAPPVGYIPTRLAQWYRDRTRTSWTFQMFVSRTLCPLSPAISLVRHSGARVSGPTVGWQPRTLSAKWGTWWAGSTVTLVCMWKMVVVVVGWRCWCTIIVPFVPLTPSCLHVYLLLLEVEILLPEILAASFLPAFIVGRMSHQFLLFPFSLSSFLPSLLLPPHTKMYIHFF